MEKEDYGLLELFCFTLMILGIFKLYSLLESWTVNDRFGVFGNSQNMYLQVSNNFDIFRGQKIERPILFGIFLKQSQNSCLHYVCFVFCA